MFKLDGLMIACVSLLLYCHEESEKSVGKLVVSDRVDSSSEIHFMRFLPNLTSSNYLVRYDNFEIIIFTTELPQREQIQHFTLIIMYTESY